VSHRFVYLFQFFPVDISSRVKMIELYSFMHEFESYSFISEFRVPAADFMKSEWGIKAN
jgi:hypothetical protein